MALASALLLFCSTTGFGSRAAQVAPSDAELERAGQRVFNMRYGYSRNATLRLRLESRWTEFLSREGLLRVQCEASNAYGRDTSEFHVTVNGTRQPRARPESSPGPALPLQLLTNRIRDYSIQNKQCILVAEDEMIRSDRMGHD